MRLNTTAITYIARLCSLHLHSVFPPLHPSWGLYRVRKRLCIFSPDSLHSNTVRLTLPHRLAIPLLRNIVARYPSS